MTAPILVTGAGGDIGMAIIRRLARAGWQVLATAPEGERLRVEELGVAFLPAQLPAGIDRLLNDIPPLLGGIVHAAGTIATHEATDFDPRDFTRLMDINVRVPIELTARLADRVQPGGGIVFVGSIAGVRASPKNLIYGASKAALHNAAQSFAKALAERRVRVNTVIPGVVAGALTAQTNARLAAMTSRDDAQIMADRVAAIPLGRITTPDDVAAAIVHLIGGDAGMTTGTQLTVTGGADL